MFGSLHRLNERFLNFSFVVAPLPNILRRIDDEARINAYDAQRNQVEVDEVARNAWHAKVMVDRADVVIRLSYKKRVVECRECGHILRVFCATQEKVAFISLKQVFLLWLPNFPEVLRFGLLVKPVEWDVDFHCAFLF